MNIHYGRRLDPRRCKISEVIKEGIRHYVDFSKKLRKFGKQVSDIHLSDVTIYKFPTNIGRFASIRE